MADPFMGRSKKQYNVYVYSLIACLVDVQVITQTEGNRLTDDLIKKDKEAQKESGIQSALRTLEILGYSTESLAKSSKNKA